MVFHQPNVIRLLEISEKVKKKPCKSMIARFFLLRRERDSNPRYPFEVYTLSRRAPSTTRTPLLGGVQK